MTDRKTMIVLAVFVAVAVVAQLVGIGAGLQARPSGANDWQQRLAGIGCGAPLRTRDLHRDSGGCAVGSDQVTLTGRCQLSVPRFGGSFSIGSVTKRGTFTALGSTVVIGVVVEGATTTKTLSPGSGAQLTFGRSGGSLTLVCAAATPCQVRLTR